MHHLVVGEHEDILLAVCVAHGKCHQVVGSLPEIGVQLHIFSKIVHPAHVPLQAEAQAVVLHLARHLGPCGGLLRDHHRPRISPQDHGIQMLEKSDSLQVLVTAVLVGHPLAVLLAVIQIEHGCHGIYPKPVHMVVLYPEQGVGDKEILHLIFPVVKNLCPPVRVLSLSGIRVLKGGCPVKVRKPVGIPGKMSRHPVQDNANPVAVQIIDHPGKVLRRAVTGRGSEISCHLVAPGAVKGVLRNPHDLNVGIAHVFHILHDFSGKFPVIVEAVLIVLCQRVLLPRSDVDFIDGHRLNRMVPRLAVLHPLSVCPGNARQVHHPGRCPRPLLRIVGKGVCLQDILPFVGLDAVFIK